MRRHALCPLTLLLLGCGASLPTLPSTSPTASQARLQGLPGDKPPGDIVRVGDRLVLELTEGQVTTERKAWVQADGRVHVASGSDVEVSGVDLERAQQRVSSALQAKDKALQVHVRRDADVQHQATVLGAVSTPGRATLQPGLRLSGLVAAAGGLLPAMPRPDGRMLPSPADSSAARLLRGGVALPVELPRALRGEAGHDVYVHPGDFLYVPYVERGVTVIGQVSLPSVLAYQPGLKLTQALALAGGVTSGGDRDDIRVVRGSLEKPKAYRASLDDIADGDRGDAEVLRGDVLFVQDHALEDVSEVLLLALPFAGAASLFLLTAVVMQQ